MFTISCFSLRNISCIFIVLLIVSSCHSTTEGNEASKVLVETNYSTQNKQSMAYEDLYVDDFKEKIETDSNAVILDVRTQEEVDAGSIEGHININIFDDTFAEEVSKLDKSKTYLVYCRSGRRSANACQVMASKGFEKLFNLEGGYMAWEANGY